MILPSVEVKKHSLRRPVSAGPQSGNIRLTTPLHPVNYLYNIRVLFPRPCAQYVGQIHIWAHIHFGICRKLRFLT